MAAKSPTSVRSREIIGVELFSQRREVFDKHDTVFLPPASPTSLVPTTQVQHIVTSNHGKTTSNFKRNAPAYSSMRETGAEDRTFEFRPRKYSDNFTSELNQSDDVDYRRSMTDRTRRLSKLRRDFLNSNLHEPSNESPFNRSGLRASLPAKSPPARYKIESPNLYKFPFAEPYATPPPVRKVVVDLGPVEANDIGKENKDPDKKPKHQSLPNDTSTKIIDHQKLFEELVKRYSPHRKPVDWRIPPTRPKVVGSMPKSTSSVADGIDSVEAKKHLDELKKPDDDEVFHKKQESKDERKTGINVNNEDIKSNSEESKSNGPKITVEDVDKNGDENKERDSKVSLTELAEKNDEVPELSTIQRQISRESPKRPHHEEVIDLTIPALLDKMIAEGEDLENNKKSTKKVKRKRSFIDKLLGRNKNK